MILPFVGRVWLSVGVTSRVCVVLVCSSLKAGCELLRSDFVVPRTGFCAHRGASPYAILIPPLSRLRPTLARPQQPSPTPCAALEVGPDITSST